MHYCMKIKRGLCLHWLDGANVKVLGEVGEGVEKVVVLGPMVP